MPWRFLTVFFILTGLAHGQHGAFQTVEADGRPTATYYAVEPLMRVALDQMSDYYSKRKGQAFRVWEDHLMPLDLKELEHKPAEVLMRRWFEEFFKDQHPETGLVPLGGISRPSERIYTILDQSQCMFLVTMSKATPFLAWFPDDAEVRSRCVKLAEGFLKHCRAGRSDQSGLFTAVRADTGFPESDLTNVVSYGSAIVGLARTGAATGRKDLLEAAKGIAGWVSAFSMKYTLGIVPEKFHASGGMVNDLSSDGIYWIRALGDAYETTKDEFYRDLIIKHGNVYFEKGWSEEFQHFSTHVEVDHEGFHPAGSMYGDTKYNYPSLLCLLTRLTGDPKYMKRFDALWATFLRESHNDWMPQSLAQGRRIERKGQPIEDKNQNIYLSLLLDAYETTKQEKYLAQAGQWVEKLLTEDGRAHWRHDTLGIYLIHYARLAKRVARLEIRLPGQGPTKVQLLNAKGEAVFSADVPSPVAVLYVAPGKWTVRADGCRDASAELSPEDKRTLSLSR